MELPDDAPKLPKLPFLIGDLVFLGIAAYLISQASSPPSTASIVAIVICAGIAVALGLAPFIADYSRIQDQQLAERQSALEALVRTTASAADQAGIAAHGLHEIADITKRNLHTIDELPARIEAARQSAKLKENHQHATAVEALRTDFDQLREEQAGNIESTTQLLEKLVEQVTALDQRLKDGIDALETKIGAAPAVTVAAPPPPPPPPRDDVVDVPADAPPKPKAKKPKEKPPAPPEPSLFDGPEDTEIADVVELDDVSFIDDESDAPEEPDFDAVEPALSDEEEAIEEESAPASNDAVTRITITAYIGIGNRLFVRGDGPGLSPDEGTPLQFVSIGKWRWETSVATSPMKLTVWKNDQELCTSLGEIELKPGAQLETNANF